MIVTQHIRGQKFLVVTTQFAVELGHVCVTLMYELAIEMVAHETRPYLVNPHFWVAIVTAPIAPHFDGCNCTLLVMCHICLILCHTHLGDLAVYSHTSANTALDRFSTSRGCHFLCKDVRGEQSVVHLMHCYDSWSHVVEIVKLDKMSAEPDYERQRAAFTSSSYFLAKIQPAPTLR